VGLGISSLANAVIIYDVQNSELFGASGIVVNGLTYSVTFVDGTCEQIFGTCESSKFTFQTEESALEASQALLDIVFLDGVYMFDSVPTHTNGCESTSSECQVITPYGIEFGADEYVRSATANNDVTTGRDFADVSFTGIDKDLTNEAFMVWASWTLEVDDGLVTVPEPSTLAIFALGLMGLGLHRFKK
jgi:hypothetical protein